MIKLGAAKSRTTSNNKGGNAYLKYFLFLLRSMALAKGTGLSSRLRWAIAVKMAMEAGMDLVEISPNNDPPVCKIMDYGKFKYSAQKKAAEARKKQKTVEIKEIKLRPMIDDHDYDVKMRAMQRFFEEGDKVKITLRYRGREMAHQEIGTKLLDKVKAAVADVAKVEQDARFEGRQVVMATPMSVPVRWCRPCAARAKWPCATT